MRGNLNTQIWLDNDTKRLGNAFTHNLYELTWGIWAGGGGGAPPPCQL